MIPKFSSPNFGWYEYKNKAYGSKEEMFDHMCEKVDIPSPLESLYNFHDHIFSNLDWTREPNISIQELYKQRAQQLRDSYDYLILMYSGGADSTQVLKSFIENDIHLDEIQVYTLEKAMKNLSSDFFEKNPKLNYLLEAELAAKPVLKKVHEKFPKIKINFVDTSDYAYEQVVEKKFDLLGSSGVENSSFNAIPRTYRTTTSYSVYYNSELGSNSAIIRGVEKPFFTLDNNLNVSFQFSDQGYLSIKMVRMASQKANSNLSFEDFFWSKDVPLIPVKQIHMIKTHLKDNKKFASEFIKHFMQKNIKNTSRQDKVDFIRDNIDPIIYPKWQPLFSGEKLSRISAEFEIFKSLNYDVRGQEQLDWFAMSLSNRWKLLPYILLSEPLRGKKYFVFNLHKLFQDGNLNK